MIRLAALSLCLCTTACFFDHSDPGNDDIVGPYTGARTRYVVDSMLLPMNNSEARLYGSDLNGDKTVDNQLGQVISTLLSANPNEQHIADRIAGGELQMVVEIQADSLVSDDDVGVWVYGFDDLDPRPIGGAIVEGAFIPNFVRDTDPENTGSAILPIPLMADADTSRAEVPYMEISLVPVGNGYDAQIHGMVRNAYATAREAIQQQLAEWPQRHRIMWSLMDTNHDGTVESSEISNNSLLQSLLAPDVTVDGEKLLSIGIGFHLTACPSGNCAVSTPDDSCFDRLLDGDEVGIDCGGSCGRCGTNLACGSDDDCQSGNCRGDNTCGAATCFDGIKNGFEGSADCGGACAKKCNIGQACGIGYDCQYRCSAPYTNGTGVCQGPDL